MMHWLYIPWTGVALFLCALSFQDKLRPLGLHWLRKALRWPMVWRLAARICDMLPHEAAGFCFPCAAKERRKKPPVLPSVIYDIARDMEQQNVVPIRTAFWDNESEE